MADDVLVRIKEEQKAQKKKRLLIIRTVSSLAIMGIVILLGVGLWQSGIMQPIAPGEESEKEHSSTQETEQKELSLADKMAMASWAAGKTQVDSGLVDSGASNPRYEEWNGLHCMPALYNLLEEKNDETAIFAIHVTDRRKHDLWTFDQEFVYDGESYSEFWQRIRTETDEGKTIDWAEVQVRDDMFQKAYAEYLAEEFEKSMQEQGISVYVKNSQCYIFVTEEEFAEIELEGRNRYYIFAHAGKDDSELQK